MKHKKNALPFDKRGGVITIQRRIIESDSYRSLSHAARCLMVELQTQWRNDRPVAFGTREAANKLNCDRRVAMKAFKELHKSGFILLEDEALFNSRNGSKARTWILTWLPYLYNPPSHHWERSNKSSST